MLKGQRVLLRATTRDDMARQVEAENDAEIWYLDGGRPRVTSLEKLLAMFDQMASKDEGNDIAYAIEVDGKYIGHCGLHDVDATAHSCELSVEIGDRSYWGQGYGREVVSMLLRYAFLHMNLNRVWLSTHAENERAIRCYKACGFVEEGRLRQHLWLNGHYIDRIIMGILRQDAQFGAAD